MQDIIQPLVFMLKKHPLFLYFFGCDCVIFEFVITFLHHFKLSNFPDSDLELAQNGTHLILFYSHIYLWELPIELIVEIT